MTGLKSHQEPLFLRFRPSNQNRAWVLMPHRSMRHQKPLPVGIQNAVKLRSLPSLTLSVAELTILLRRSVKTSSLILPHTFPRLRPPQQMILTLRM